MSDREKRVWKKPTRGFQATASAELEAIKAERRAQNAAAKSKAPEPAAEVVDSEPQTETDADES